MYDRLVLFERCDSGARPDARARHRAPDVRPRDRRAGARLLRLRRLVLHGDGAARKEGAQQRH